MKMFKSESGAMPLPIDDTSSPTTVYVNENVVESSELKWLRNLNCLSLWRATIFPRRMGKATNGKKNHRRMR